MRTLIFSICSTALLALGACSTDENNVVSREDCQKVREHEADLRSAAITMNKDIPQERADRERAKHRKNLTRAGGSAYLDSCTADHSNDWVECSLNAPDVEKLNECSKL